VVAVKRKTAIEECIDRKPMNWTPMDDARDRRAMAELRALLRLAKLTVAAQLASLSRLGELNAKVDRTLARLRRLGVLPEVRRG